MRARVSLIGVVALGCACASTSADEGRDSPSAPAPTAAPTPDASAPADAAVATDPAAIVIGLDGTPPDLRYDWQRKDAVLQYVVDARVGGDLIAVETIDGFVGFPLPHATTVHAPPAAADEPVVLRIRGLTEIGVVKETRFVSTRFVKGSRRLAYVLLGSCEACPTGTCAHGTCVDNVSLPEYRADWTASPCGGGAPSVTLVDGKTPIADGASIPLEFGPQGGAHFWITLWYGGFDRATTVVTFDGTQPSTGKRSTPTSAAIGDAVGNVDGTCETNPVQFRVDNGDLSRDTIRGQAFDISVAVKDGTGHAATLMRHVLVKP